MADKAPTNKTGRMNNSYSKASSITAVVVTVIALCVIGFLVWWFGFRSTGSTAVVTSSAASQPAFAQTQAEVSHNWTEFFNGKTPAAARVNLLQNGQQFSQALDAFSQTPTGKSASATVSKISMLNPTTASVTYDIDLNGQPALKGQTGQAVLENGTWKVSDAALCGLLALAGQSPAQCPASSQSQPTQGQPAK